MRRWEARIFIGSLKQKVLTLQKNLFSSLQANVNFNNVI